MQKSPCDTLVLPISKGRDREKQTEVLVNLFIYFIAFFQLYRMRIFFHLGSTMVTAIRHTLDRQQRPMSFNYVYSNVDNMYMYLCIIPYQVYFKIS